jgi:hypothetical protein
MAIIESAFAFLLELATIPGRSHSQETLRTYPARPPGGSARGSRAHHTGAPIAAGSGVTMMAMAGTTALWTVDSIQDVRISSASAWSDRVWQSTCAGCANFAVTEKHRAVWAARRQRNSDLLVHPALDPESRALAAARIEECDRILADLNQKPESKWQVSCEATCPCRTRSHD